MLSSFGICPCDQCWWEDAKKPPIRGLGMFTGAVPKCFNNTNNKHRENNNWFKSQIVSQQRIYSRYSQSGQEYILMF